MQTTTPVETGKYNEEQSIHYSGVRGAGRPFILPPILLITLYYFNSMNPPGFTIINSWEVRWYILLVLAAGAYWLTGERVIEYRSARPFWHVVLLIAGGAVISLLRTPELGLALKNTVGFYGTIASLYFFLVVLRHRTTRIALLVALLLAATLWTIKIHSTYQILGEDARLFWVGRGLDKNALALMLSQANTVVFTIALFWRPNQQVKLFALMVRLLLFGLVAFWLYTTSQLFSRSGLMTAFVGLAGVLLLLSYTQRGRGFFKSLIITSITSALLISYLPRFLETFPTWQIYYERVVNYEKHFDTRLGVLEKAQLIIEENPLLGIGAGVFKTLYVDVGGKGGVGRVAHNTYAGTWAELGFLGIFAYVVWGFYVLKLLRDVFPRAHLVDQAWMASLIPFFFMLAFLDIGLGIMLSLTGAVDASYLHDTYDGSGNGRKPANVYRWGSQ